MGDNNLTFWLIDGNFFLVVETILHINQHSKQKQLFILSYVIKLLLDCSHFQPIAARPVKFMKITDLWLYWTKQIILSLEYYFAGWMILWLISQFPSLLILVFTQITVIHTLIQRKNKKNLTVNNTTVFFQTVHAFFPPLKAQTTR